MSVQTEINRIKAAVAAAYAAVSGKGGTVPASKTVANLAAAISGIQLGTDTSDATAAAGDILNGKTAYVKGAEVTGTIPNKTVSDIAQGVFHYGGLDSTPVGYAVELPAGYYPYTRKFIGEVQYAKTVTPKAAEQTAVSAGYYTTGDVKVAGDANLVAGNIKKGVSIFGVAGTVEEGVSTSDATAAAGDILSGKTAYAGGVKVTGTMPEATQATPSITVSSTGLITAKTTQTAGYVPAGTKSATKQLTKQAAKTWTPGTADQTIAKSTYLTGIQTIKGDANLAAGNIKSGVSIFGVAGTYEGATAGATVYAGTVKCDGNTVATCTYISSASGSIQTATVTTAGISISALGIIVIKAAPGSSAYTKITYTISGASSKEVTTVSTDGFSTNVIKPSSQNFSVTIASGKSGGVILNPIDPK